MLRHPVVILRHPKERLSKCSLEPLRGRHGLTFHTAREGFLFDATGHLLLSLNGPELSGADATDADGQPRPLLLLDATWRLLPALERSLTGEPLPRRLPGHLRTAYPRTSKIARDPAGGLASVEALYAALLILRADHPELLAHYHWRESFLIQFAANNL